MVEIPSQPGLNAFSAELVRRGALIMNSLNNFNGVQAS